MKKFISCILVMVITMSLFGTLPANAENDSLEPNAQMETDISVQGTNSFGNLMTKALTTEMDKQEENNGCNIFSIEMNGANASVSFETTEDCTLLVAVYTESGEQMLASGNTAVVKGETETLVTIDTDSMPQYYYLRGFLVDSDTLRPLCTVYESPNYTQEMQEFFAKTVDDFDSEKVLNLDEDEFNNFAVFSDETIIIKQNGTVNRVTKADDNTRTYVIANADSTVKSLKNGNIFTCEYGNETLIVKVDRISIGGSDVTIYGQDTSMEEVFDYIKIDTSYNESQRKNSRAISLNPESKISLTIFDTSAISDSPIRGKIKATLAVQLKIYLTRKYQYVEAKVIYGLEASLSIEKEIIDIPLVKTSIVTIPTPVGVNVSVDLSINITAEAKLEFVSSISGQFGIAYDSDIGKAKSLNSFPSFNNELKKEYGFSISISIIPNINIINSKIVNIHMENRMGRNATLEQILWQSHEDDDSKHECDNCFEGKISIKNTTSYGLELTNKNVLNRELYETEVKTHDFYYSKDRDELGWGKCPYILYLTNIRAVDTNGNPICNASVTNNNTNIGETDSNGNFKAWLPNGEHFITVKKDNETATRNITIYDNPKSVVLRFKSQNSNNNISSGFRQVALGLSYSGVITEDGGLYMWGKNSNGQLGNGTTEDSLVPIKIMDNVKSISLGCGHSAAITEDGSLYTWGYNNYGQLGNGTKEDSLVPLKIMDSVKSVSLGGNHSAAIKEDGSLYTWGNNAIGQLGNGTRNISTIPQRIMSNVKSVSLGWDHSAAIKEDSSFYMWGSNLHGELGNGLKTAKLAPIKIMDNVKSVSLGSYHSAVIKEDNSLYIWGSNSSGQLGNGKSGYSDYSLIPIKILDNVKSVSLGYGHSATIKEDGSLYMWGENEKGYLGNGTIEKSLVPLKIKSNVKMISVGNIHSAAITEDGSLYTWGDNEYGQLGNGTTEDSYIPVKIQIPFSSSYSTVSALSLESSYPTETFNLHQSPTLLADEEYGIPTIWDATISYRGLKPNETYNFYAMKSENAKNPLNSDNLLYITQSVSDANGNLEIPYVAKEQYENAVTFVKASLKTDLSSALVTIPDILCNGEEQFAEPKVTLNGETLTEGVDYDIEKRYSAIYPGEYELVITGIRNYRGEISATYNIYCKHSFANNKCTICKSLKDSVGDANGDGVVGVADLVVLQEFLLAKRKDISINADIDKDGVIDVFDMCLLRKIVSNALI